MIDEKELKEALDEAAFVDGNLSVDENTYNTAIRHLPKLVKYLCDFPRINNIDSKLIFKFGKDKKSSLQISGNDAALKISYGTFLTKTIGKPMGNDLSEEDFQEITNCF